MMQSLELSPAQLRAMASTSRAEIISALAQHGSQSARDLAAYLGRPVSGLYHHIDLLERAGLLRQIATRATSRRPEKVYALASEQLSSRSAVQSRAGRSALAKVARRFLIASARSVADALNADAGVTEGPSRDTAVRRIQVRLDRRALAQFNSELDRLLERTQANSGARGKGIELTIGLAPASRKKSAHKR